MEGDRITLRAFESIRYEMGMGTQGQPCVWAVIKQGAIEYWIGDDDLQEILDKMP